MIKGMIQQDNVTLVNIYASNKGTLQYIKQILMDLNEENLIKIK